VSHVSPSEEVFRYKLARGASIVFRLRGKEVDVEFEGVSAPFVRFFLGSSLMPHFKYYKYVKVLAERDRARVFTLYYPPFPSKPFVKMLKTVARTMITRRFVPRAVTIAVTSGCQCRCLHCSAAKYAENATAFGKKELSTDELKGLIDECIELGAVNITFTGGEPLLRPDIYDLISYVDKEEAITQLFTNGLLLTGDNVRRLKEAGLYSLEVSLDSPYPEEHDSFRGIDGGFEAAVRGIKYALEEGLLVGISTYATRERIKDGSLELLIDLGRKLGVHEVSIFDPVPTGRLLGSEDVLLTENERAYLMKIQRSYNQMEGHTRVSTQSAQCSPVAFYALGCFSGTNQAYVTAFGDVNPCDFTPLTFGNIREEPFEKIWWRIREHPAYRNKTMRCKMQNMSFREKYIHKIPEQIGLPCPINCINSNEQEEGKTASSLTALISAQRLKILDTLYPRFSEGFKLVTKGELAKRKGIEPESLDRNLEVLIRASLIRTEEFMNETYILPCLPTFWTWLRFGLVHLLFRLRHPREKVETAEITGLPGEEVFEFIW
jgi:MoaA/NifB/PqqE/SkfB family radical SAM enzyme